jgi:hypothetical protein
LFSRKRKNGKQQDLAAFTALPELIALAKASQCGREGVGNVRLMFGGGDKTDKLPS